LIKIIEKTKQVINYWRPRFQEGILLLRYISRIQELKKLSKADIVLFCADGNRGYLFEGKKYAQIVDSINDRLSGEGIKCLTIASPYSDFNSEEVYGNVVKVNGLITRAIFARAIKRAFGFHYNPFKCPVVRAWGEILSRIDSKYIIGIQPSSELCLAAKECGILVADIQHGVLSDEGYYGMSYRENFAQMGWPDYILCWDKGSETWIQNRLGNLVKAILIGNPWFHRFIKPNKNDKLVQEALEINRKRQLVTTILVTLQWGMNRFGSYHETGIPYELINFIKQKGQNCQWLFRLHPLQQKQDIKEKIFLQLESLFIGFNNIFWENCSDEPLPIVLSYIDLHITSHSAVTIESSWFGIKTALLLDNSELLLEFFNQQIIDRHAEIVKPTQEAIEIWLKTHQTRMNNEKHSHIDLDSLNIFISGIKNQVYNRQYAVN
jgi:hypothetical protein